jgi:23S rRNA (cytosine1962-C5)-methyltransferase
VTPPGSGEAAPARSGGASAPTSLPRVVLRRGRARPLEGRHPWLFSGAIHRVDGPVADGDEVLVVDADGTPLSRGLYNGRSQIRVRLYGWDPETPLDGDFWDRRVTAALAARRRIPGLGPGDPARLVFSEADGLSGLTVDRYDRWLVVQVTSLALHARLPLLLDLLEAHLARAGEAPEGILLRTEKGIGEEEGLVVEDGLLRGRAPEGPVLLADGALRFRADLRVGQKTGFYLDQRENRRRVAAWGEGRRVADVCCYTGGFGLHLARAGAREVTGVDVSAPTLELAEENARLNGVDERVRYVRNDAFRWLEGEAREGRSYDLVVLDPPRFARSRRGVSGALRGYARLNEAALRVLEPGGLLVTCSCTGRVSREQFLQVLAGVSERTGRRLRILEQRGQPPDHPVDPACPETAYLKCVLLEAE